MPARLHIEDAANKRVPLTIIPHHFAGTAGQPLQHAPLLPVPGQGAADLCPAIVVLQVHVSQLDAIIRPGRTVLKIHLIPQHQTTRHIKLKFVVIAKPVLLWPARDGTDRRQRGGSLRAGSNAKGSDARGLDETAAGEHWRRLRQSICKAKKKPWCPVREATCCHLNGPRSVNLIALL